MLYGLFAVVEEEETGEVAERNVESGCREGVCFLVSWN